MLQLQLVLRELSESVSSHERIMSCNRSLIHFIACAPSDFVPAKGSCYVSLCVGVFTLSLGHVSATGPFMCRSPYYRWHNPASCLNNELL